MAVFGQGINPALGRIDYTPYAQGAVAGAQGIAQGLAALGQGAAQGVQNYLKRKEEKQQEEATISTIGGILKRNPELASQLNLQPDATGNFEKGALKAFVNGAGGLPNALKLASTLEELGVQRQARQQQADAARFAGMFDNQGQMLSPLRSDALSQFSPEARAMGQQMVTQRAQALANLGKTQAEEAALRAPKPTSIEALRYQSQQEKDAAESRINTRANQIALGQKGSPLPNKAEENAAMVAASKIYEAGLRPNVVEVPNPQTGRTEFFTETRDITGKLVGRKPVYAPNLTPEEQATAAEQVATAQSAVKWVDQFSENASSAGVRLSKNKAALSLLESGKVQTGPGAPIIQNFRRVFAAYGGDPKTIQETADFGLLTNLLGDQLIDYFSKTKGAISDYETKYFSTLAAKENKTNAENVAILKIAIALDERTQAANKALRQAIKNGEVKTARDQRMFIEDYVDSNPIDFNLIPAQAVDPIIERNLRNGGK